MSAVIRPAEGASVAAPAGVLSWRRNLVFVWLGVFVGLMGAQFVFPFMPFYIQELGVQDKADVAMLTGLTTSAAGLSLTLTAPLWGSLADRFGRKPMFIRALVGAGIAIGAMGLASAVWQVVLLRFIMGAFAGTMGAAAALVAATTPREQTGRALGLLQTAAFSANMLGPFIGGLVAANLGLRESFVFCACLYGAAAVLAYLFVREGESDEGSTKRKAGGGSLIGNLRVVISERQIVFMLGMLFVLWLSTSYVRPVLAIRIDGFAVHEANGQDHVRLALPYFQRDVPEELAAGMLFGVLGASSVIAALSLGPLSSRFGYRNMVTGAALATGLLYIPVALAPSYTGFVAMFGAIGLFQGAMVPGTNALIAANTPDGKQGSAFGLAASMQSLALLVGPLSGGFTSAFLGIDAVFVIIGCLLIAVAGYGRMVIREPAH